MMELDGQHLFLGLCMSVFVRACVCVRVRACLTLCLFLCATKKPLSLPACACLSRTQQVVMAR